VLDQATVERLRRLDGGGLPILSVYLNLEPGAETLRSIPTRLKDVLSDVKQGAERLPRGQRMSLRADIDALSKSPSLFGSDLGRGVAIFKCSGAGIDEHVVLPGPVRDRAVVDLAAYVRPLEAMLDHYRRFCVCIVDARFASIFRFRMDRLETWEEMRSPAFAEEDFRKVNYGGFSGYEERRVRSHADEVLVRHYRDIAARLDALFDEDPGYDLLMIGGSEAHASGLTGVLPPRLANRVAGTFVIDPHTMTAATVLEHSKRVAEAYEAAEQRSLVARLFDASAGGGAAVVGIEESTNAANHRAVEVLVVQADRTSPGAVCGSCGWISRPEQKICPACGNRPSWVPDIIDALGESVRNSGGTIEHVVVDTKLAGEQVGAFLRYQAASA
jgi:peptide chain release factor subunit 1